MATIELPEDFGDGPQYVPGSMDRISNPNNLHEAFINCRKSVNWKESVQRYGLNELSNISNIIDKLEDKTYQMSDPYEFTLNERGHLRYIKALNILDRVIQRSFNDNILNPAIKNKLIYDNGASQKDKGVSFSRKRFKEHLQKAYNEYGYDGYILMMDFSKYFDNILHEEMLNQFKPFLSSDEFWYLQETFSTFDIDASYMSDEEFLNYKDRLFNMLEYHMIDQKLLTGEKIMHKSVGIGNQTSQASGIYYPHDIDNYVKIVKGIKYYGRYMDDSYVIMQTKEELYELLKEIKNICDGLGIHINTKKTRIQPLYTEISYLKINYRIEPTGRILELVPTFIFEREKYRLKKFKKLYDEHRMSAIDILQCFLSWKGSYLKFDSSRKVYEMELFFRNLFNIPHDINLHDLLREGIMLERQKNCDTKYLYEI